MKASLLSIASVAESDREPAVHNILQVLHLLGVHRLNEESSQVPAKGHPHDEAKPNPHAKRQSEIIEEILSQYQDRIVHCTCLRPVAVEDLV